MYEEDSGLTYKRQKLRELIYEPSNEQGREEVEQFTYFGAPVCKERGDMKDLRNENQTEKDLEQHQKKKLRTKLKLYNSTGHYSDGNTVIQM